MTPRNFKLYLAWLLLVVGFLSCQIVLLWFQPLVFPQPSIRHPQRDRAGGAQHHPLQYNANEYQRSCSDLFGAHQLVKFNDGSCLRHSILNWVSCNIGSVSIDTSKIEGSIGGEEIASVLNRKAEVEFLKFTQGSLVLRKPLLKEFKIQSADSVVKAFLKSGTLLQTNRTSSTHASVETTSNQVTLFVRRTTYANPCMALMSMYNVYIVVLHMLGSLKLNISIVWLDGHAISKNLDEVWEDLFQTKPIHIKQMNGKHQIVQNAIVINTASAIGDDGMGIYGWEGDTSCSTAPGSSSTACGNSTLVSFRDFVLDRYGVARRTKQLHDLSCQLTFLFRKDYVAHPRSNGKTDRTLANLSEDLAYIHSEYPSCNITAVSFEDMAFKEQLEIVTQSDILVSVHGAGNIHVLFLPSHGSFVEYFPKGFDRRKRFQYLSECLNISYQSKKARIEQTFPDRKVTVRLRPNT